MAQNTLQIVVDVSAQGARRAFNTLDRGFDGLRRGVRAVGEQVFSLQGAIAGLAIGAGLKEMIGFMMDTEDASKKMAAGLQLGTEKAKELTGVAKELYRLNFGESVGANMAIVQKAFQDMGDIGSKALGDVVKNAIRIEDAFGVDAAESIQAADTLMENFALTSDEAFDFIASGFKKGLNNSDDFYQSINQYGVQFKEGGTSAAEFFSIMESGYQGGFLGVDMASDTFQEFRVRIMDGSKGVSDALEQIGIDSDAFVGKLANGTMTTAQAFQQVLVKLRATKDLSVQMQAGVGLIGTQFETLGTEAVLSLDMTGTKMKDLKGSAVSLDKQYDTLLNTLKGIWRRFQDGITKGLEASNALGLVNTKIQELIEKGKLDVYFKEMGVVAVKVFAAMVEGIGWIPAAFQTVKKAVYEASAFIQAFGASTIEIIQYMVAVTEDPVKLVKEGVDAVTPKLADLKKTINDLGMEYTDSAVIAETQKKKYVEMGKEASKLADEIRKVGTKSKELAEAKPIEVEFLAEPGKVTDEMLRLADGTSDAIPKNVSVDIPIKADADAARQTIKDLAKPQEPVELKILPEMTEFKRTVGSLQTWTYEIIDGKWVEVPIKADDDEARQAIKDLTKPETKVVTIETVQTSRAGGPALARGGALSGYGGGDRINALLEAGEFVIRKEAVRRYGSNLFAALNAMTLDMNSVRARVGGMITKTQSAIPAFASGGMAGSAPKNMGSLDMRFSNPSQRGMVIGDQSLLKRLTDEVNKARLAAEI